MQSVAIEGMDGSGKTSVVDALKNILVTECLNVAIFAPFRIANEKFGEDIYPLWKSRHGAAKALEIMEKTFQECHDDALQQNADVCLYDRHWMTVMTEIDGNHTLMEKFETFVPAALLRVTPEVARERMGNDRESIWSTPGMLQRYATSYQKVAGSNFNKMLGIYRSDPDVSVETLARNIRWDMNLTR